MTWEYFNGKQVIFILLIGFLITSIPITTTPEAVTGEPRRGGTLRIAYLMDCEEMNNVIKSSTPATIPFSNVNNRLITLSPDWSFQPQLAHDWDIDDNGRKYTFYLEEGVKFHDGVEMTSADVKHTYMAAYGYQSPYGLGKFLVNAGLKNITTPDDYSVVFEFERGIELSTFAATLTGDSFIKPKHRYETPEIDWETLHVWTPEEKVKYEEYSHSQDDIRKGEGYGPIGTGPFQLVDYKPWNYFHFKRFNGYWEEGLPYLDDLFFQVIPDANASVLALLNGEIDAFNPAPSYPFPLESVNWINGMNDFAVESLMPMYGTYRICFNMNPASSPKDPLSVQPDEQWVLNNDVRIAMEYAIDKEAIIQKIYQGVVSPVYTAVPEQIAGHNAKLEPRTYNKEIAEQLLDAAGYTIQPDGWRLHNVVFKSYHTLSDLAKEVEFYLRDVGIEAISSPLNQLEFYNTYELGKGIGGPYWNALDEFQEAFAICHQGAISTITPYIFWLYTWDERDIGFSYNFGHYSNARVDELFDYIRTEMIYLEYQDEAWDEIQEIIWKENPLIFLMPSFRHEAWNIRFTGFNPSNRPSPAFGSYKLVYDTTITVPLFDSKLTIIVYGVGMFVSFGIAVFNSKKRKYRY